MTFRPPSFSPSCARLGDFLYLTARRLCLFHSQYKHGRLFFALEPVEILLRGQLFVRIVVVLPLREHIIDPPDDQQVEIGIVLIVLPYALFHLAHPLGVE